ncbi:hypothetical protein EV138_3295 [Kribbella voronezhensis]|uniref:Uncharacterized protein n=1 Tax=Kribbella voronezhensis TaxID=2512212 RepID=A0A4R7TD78_9ACTN|nr:hypothetical protein [Kribbella voronezhensis]TDU89719.1 hypothetical protein EV138_3295 [Kribbella voronezhensis]
MPEADIGGAEEPATKFRDAEVPEADIGGAEEAATELPDPEVPGAAGQGMVGVMSVGEVIATVGLCGVLGLPAVGVLDGPVTRRRRPQRRMAVMTMVAATKPRP